MKNRHRWQVNSIKPLPMGRWRFLKSTHIHFFQQKCFFSPLFLDLVHTHLLIHDLEQHRWILKEPQPWQSIYVATEKQKILCHDFCPSQGAKKIIFTACHSGKLKLAFTSPDVISTSPRHFLTSRIDFIVLLLFELLKKHHLPFGQVNNTIH